MIRRRIIAGVILALVVATVVAMGPVQVWDALTLTTVEEYWPNGNLRLRYYTWRWRSVGDDTPDSIVWRRSLERWYENGQKEREELFVGRNGFVARAWLEDGRLWFHAGPSGKFSSVFADGEVRGQALWSGDHVERRKSPPWFTEEEILQSVEGVEE